MNNLPINLDVIAPIFFLLSWIVYTFIADTRIGRKRNLLVIMHRYRVQWIKRMLCNNDRFVDIRMVGNLLSTSTFLASTSVLIVAGFVTILGYGEKAILILNKLPFIAETNIATWSIKTSFLLLIFIYSFFKFTWVVRQFNYIAVLMLAAPVYSQELETSLKRRKNRHARQISRLFTNAARHFNIGIRSYYFGFAALSWYVGPLFLIIVTILLLVILYRREFMSKTYWSLR